MRDLTDILKEVTSHKYDRAEGPVLEFVKELAKEGRFNDIGTLLSEYAAIQPRLASRVSEHLSAIIENQYLIGTLGFRPDVLVAWENERGRWREPVNEMATDAKRLPILIANIERSLREFEANR